MKKHIVCFGDSNTHGYCAMNDGRFDENERWTCLLQKNLGEDYLVLEEGLSGRTTCFNDPLFEGLSGLDYIYPCLMSHEPVDLLVIMREPTIPRSALRVCSLHRPWAEKTGTEGCFRDRLLA